jgi:hypothetical protein
MEWRQKRLRKEPVKEGTVEFICNNPYEKRWKLFWNGKFGPTSSGNSLGGDSITVTRAS